MRYFRQTFTNKDLEREYQLEQLELTKKGYFQFQIIFITAMGILLVDQILKQNLAMIIWFILLEISTLTFLCLSYRYQTFLNYVHYHLYFFNLMGSISQILFSQCGFLNLLPNDVDIYMDMLQCNHLGTSLVYLIFVATRVFVQIVNGSSLASIAYVTFSIYFFIDQYKMSKGRRKLFLKSQRNKQLELLIEKFIDDQVSIIEKDEQNVKFKTIILNKRLSEVADQFNIFLRDVTVPQYKSHLQDYLYNSTKQRESILCYYKNQNYQITYQTFTLKKQQMFIKIKLLFQQINKQIDYKELYKSLITKMNFKPQKSYKGLYIIQKLYMNSFYLSFTRYYQYYHISQELISHQYLKHLFITSKISWMTQDFIQPFYSDKKLLYILVIILKKIIKDDIIWIYTEKEFIRIVFFVKQIIYQEQLTQINKILYHIGYGQTEQTILNSQTQVTLILMDKNGFEKLFMISNIRYNYSLLDKLSSIKYDSKNFVLEALLKRRSSLIHMLSQKLFRNFNLILNKHYIYIFHQSSVMMRKFQLGFNNLELEQEYQHEMLELAKKDYHQKKISLHIYDCYWSINHRSKKSNIIFQ